MTTKPNHDIRMWFFSRADMVKVGDTVLAALREDTQLAPEHVGPFEPYRIDLQGSAASELWRTEAAQGVGLLGGERKRPARVGLTVSLGMTPARPFHMLFWRVQASILRQPRAVERIERLFRRLAIAFDAYWGAAFDSSDFERQNVMHNYQHPDGTIQPYRVVGVDLRLALPGLYWLNFFGRPLCDFVGEQTITAAVPSAEPLGDGFVLRLAESPVDMSTKAAREQVARTRAALGEDLFFDLHQPERSTRTPAMPTPLPPTPIPPPIVPSIEDAAAFVESAATRAAKWRVAHGVGTDIVATLGVLETELDMLGLRAPSAVELAIYAAVLGQLVIEQAGGSWAAADEPYVVTASGHAVYPVSQVLKRAVDPDASLSDWVSAAVQQASP